MSINYIIATYPGSESVKRQKDINAEDTLNFHLFQLYMIFKKKKELNIDNLIKQITIIKTKPKNNNLYYKDYYKYSNLKQIDNIPIKIIDYEGENMHASYDQWLMGIEKNKEFEYHILIEDDYCIHPENYNFDNEIISLYNKYFPDKNGYLCSMACALFYHPFHAARSNGLIHINILKNVNLKDFYNYKNGNNIDPQVLFSLYFLENNIEIKGINDIYETFFWSDRLQNYTNGNTKNKMFTPVQYFDEFKNLSKEQFKLYIININN